MAHMMALTTNAVMIGPRIGVGRSAIGVEWFGLVLADMHIPCVDMHCIGTLKMESQEGIHRGCLTQCPPCWDHSQDTHMLRVALLQNETEHCHEKSGVHHY